VDAEPGEQIYFHGHPSWRSILGFYLKGLVVTVVAGVIAGLVTRISDHHVKVGIVAVVVVVFLAVVLLVGLIKRIQTTYTISNRRLTIHSGILSRELHETRLERVQNVNSTQSLLERILHVGTVDFDTAAGAEYDFKFSGVADPHMIVRTVDNAIHQLQQSPGAPAPTSET
jgi:uncharacterized membrane protein YdbT with pleckstrin-like domain